MRSATFLASLFVLNCWAADAPTYDEAVAETQVYATDPAFITWVSGTLKPFIESHFDTSVSPCLIHLEGRAIAVRFVVEVGSRIARVHMQQNAERRLSECLSDHLRGLNWPMPPSGARYLPLTLNLQSPSRTTDEVISDLTPFNTSLERTRDR